ncbi:ABC transporter substrate-binding protein [Microbacterium sp. EST19A]|uniref:ABC transporter substrate-binding protein n=1 Tax=Microbacterium sp. EST19A TaxID=2862681 RepID=UPI001CBED3FC|nr:ABC transporter substrate-binding protein [Microbacterium sp. EST19A]
MRRRRLGAAALAVAVVAGLAACTPALPASVVPGSKIAVGWTQEFTSANAAASPTAGNLDIAATTRGRFGDVVDGEFVPDEGFGTVKISSDEPFTVTYDLAEPAWSDGIPLDAADLLLGWAGAAGYFRTDDEADAGAEEGQADADIEVPAIDEFARSIAVTFAQPDIDWQSAVTVPVPAHVVGQRAFGTDDAMEAKQAVIRAIQDDDAEALAAIAEVWNEGFALPEDGKIPADLLLSSGPFQVDEVSVDEAGQSVRLVPNTGYRGLVTPKIARIDLVPTGDDPLAAIGDSLDVVQVAPVAANVDPIHELERRDLTSDTTHDGTVWALQLNPAGVFSEHAARTAFIHAAPATALLQGGGGEWASAYAGTTSMATTPGSRAYDIVNEDSGFSATLGTPGDDAALEREAAGVPAGASVCVLYDRASEFAAGAFVALQGVAGEAGWSIVDCGTDDLEAALGQRAWNAVISRVPVPQTPGEIFAQWGSGGAASITGSADPERDELIAQLAQTTDVYEARDLRARIEATIVRAAVALPLAMNPRVTIVDKDVMGIAARNGATAPLTSGVVQWEVAP